MAFVGFQLNDKCKDEHRLEQRMCILEDKLNDLLLEKLTPDQEKRTLKDHEMKFTANVSDEVREILSKDQEEFNHIDNMGGVSDAAREKLTKDNEEIKDIDNMGGVSDAVRKKLAKVPEEFNHIDNMGGVSDAVRKKLAKYPEEFNHIDNMGGVSDAVREKVTKYPEEIKNIDNMGSIRDVVRESLANSTLHGIPHLANAHYWWARVIWIACILGCIGLLAIQVKSITDQYLSSPVKTNYEIVYDDIALPAVTICNSNPFNKAKIREHPTLWKAFLETQPRLHQNHINTTHNNSSENDSVPKEDSVVDDYGSYLKIMEAFQSLPEEERVALGYKPYQLFSRPKRVYRIPNETAPSLWYGNCYTDYIESDVTQPGINSGYTIVVNLRTEDYIFSGLPFYAILSIHAYGVKPSYTYGWITLIPGQTTHVKLGLRHVSRLGGDYGICTDGVEFKKRAGIEYSVRTCRELCKYDAVYKRCGCLLTQHITINPRTNISHCSQFNNSQIECNIHYFLQKFECDCPNRCKENIYTKSVTIDAWGNMRNPYIHTGLQCDELSIAAKKYLNDTECSTYFERNIAKVYIYYPDLMHEKITEEPLYDKYRFLSDLGGTIGLYIGASVLTYVELVQLALSLLVRCFRRNRHT